MPRFLHTTRGDWLNCNSISRIYSTYSKDQTPAVKYFALDQNRETWELTNEFNGCPAPVFIPGNGVAHCFWWNEATRTAHKTTTTVIGWRISPDDMSNWPIPILLDTTDADSPDTFVVVEDQGHFESIGEGSFDSLDAAERAFVKAHAKPENG